MAVAIEPCVSGVAAYFEVEMAGAAELRLELGSMQKVPATENMPYLITARGLN